MSEVCTGSDVTVTGSDVTVTGGDVTVTGGDVTGATVTGDGMGEASSNVIQPLSNVAGNGLADFGLLRQLLSTSADVFLLTFSSTKLLGRVAGSSDAEEGLDFEDEDGFLLAGDLNQSKAWDSSWSKIPFE